ncbi:hypothetical protein Pr1d_43110 [Bythopirellula goksoeyrii]|uniref:Uncharacterized protein n=2 Tax=Bythopirellula goksoeyrii TaxID=1400387 RepID=A0A5B9QS75_9BACT|nr:hypothetical protein Pr1d_43110 [Bythopirellula goksoeyrii]
MPSNMPQSRHWFHIAMFAFVCMAIALLTSDAIACPTCKDVLADDDPLSQARAAGYFYSILFMMAMPFVLIGTFGGAAYLSIRRARQRELESNV